LIDALQMTRHDIGAGLYAPLRVRIHESRERHTCIERDRPSSLLRPFGNADIDAVAAELDRKLECLILAASGEQSSADGDLITARVFKSPRERVFKAWTDAERLAR
jgi:hypothetical protein